MDLRQTPPQDVMRDRLAGYWDKFKKQFASPSIITPNMIKNSPDWMQANPDITEADTQPLPKPSPDDIGAVSSPVSPEKVSEPTQPDLSALFPSSGADEATRTSERQGENSKRLLGLIPETVGGVGDAMMAAANAAYGGHGETDTQDTIHKGNEERIAKSRADLEENLKNDPNSDISKQYQNTAMKAFQLMGMKTPPEAFMKMSANQIAAQLPQIDKLASIQSSQDMKRLQIENMKTMREIAQGQRADVQDQKASDAVNRFVEGELKGRASDVAQQNLKVSSAIHAKEIMEGARNPRTGQVELNQVQLPELAMNLTNLITGSNTTTLEQFRDMKPETLKQYVTEKVGFLTGQPMNVTTQGWTNALEKVLDRQGATSEFARNNQLKGLKQRVQASYPNWYAKHGDQYFQSSFGNSYVDRYLGGKNPIERNTGGTSVPAVGDTFQGGKVTKVTRIE